MSVFTTFYCKDTVYFGKVVCMRSPTINQNIGLILKLDMIFGRLGFDDKININILKIH